MSIPDHDQCLSSANEILRPLVSFWNASISYIIDGTNKRIACDDFNTASSFDTVPGLSVREDTTLEFSSVDHPGSYYHRSQLPSSQRNATIQCSERKRKRSSSLASSERSSKINKYRAANAMRIAYDGEAQQRLERIVHEAERSCYDMRKRSADSKARNHASLTSDLEHIVASLQAGIDGCYAASVQLLKDGTCEAQLTPALKQFDSVLNRIQTSLLNTARAVDQQTTLSRKPTNTTVSTIQPTKPLPVLHIEQQSSIGQMESQVDDDADDDNEDDDNEDDDFVMSQIAHRLTSRMARREKGLNLTAST